MKDPKIRAYAQVSIANGAIATSRKYNCTVTRSAVGVYPVTIGEVGANESAGIVYMPVITPRASTVGGAGTGITATFSASSVYFFDDAGQAVDPVGFLFELKLYPPMVDLSA